MLDRLLFYQISALAQKRYHMLPRRSDCHAADQRHVTVDRSVRQYDPLIRKIVLLTPLDIRRIAIGRTHNSAGPLIHGYRIIGQDRDLEIIQRHAGCLSDIFLHSAVERVHQDTDAACEQLRPGGCDHKISQRRPKIQIVKCCRAFLRLQLRLRDGRLALRAPQHRRFLHIRFPALCQLYERSLGYLLRQVRYGLILQAPIHAETQPSPQVLKLLLVLFDRADAFRAERTSGHPVRTDALVPLNQPFRRQTVVVKAKRIKHIVTLHTLKARDHLCLRVGKHMPDVKFPAHCRRRCVDRKDLALFSVSVLVDLLLCPELFQFGFCFLKIILLIHVEPSL